MRLPYGGCVGSNDIVDPNVSLTTYLPTSERVGTTYGFGDKIGKMFTS